MRFHHLLTVFCALALVLGACGDDTDRDDGVAGPENQELDPVPGSDEGFCAFLSAEDIEDATGLGVDEGVADGEGCTWRLGESAAVRGGPNAGEDARLVARRIDMTTFDEHRSQATDVPSLSVDEVGEDAYLVVAEDESATTLYVAGEPGPFTLRLQGGLDGTSANATALGQLAGLVVDRR